MFFQDAVFDAMRSESPVLLGDFNCVIKPIDTEKYFAEKFDPVLADLIATFQYKDAFRILAPDTVEFTWARPNCARSRLDRLYLPEGCNVELLSLRHVPSLSDHASVRAELMLPFTPPACRKKGKSPYWKLNVSILSEEDFQQHLADLWDQLLEKEDDFPSAADWWDQGVKPAVRKMCIVYSSHRARWRRGTMDTLHGFLESSIRLEDWEEVGRVRGRMKAMLLEDSWGLVVRSRQGKKIEDEVFGALLRVRGRKEGALIRPGALGFSTTSFQEDPRVAS